MTAGEVLKIDAGATSFNITGAGICSQNNSYQHSTISGNLAIILKITTLLFLKISPYAPTTVEGSERSSNRELRISSFCGYYDRTRQLGCPQANRARIICRTETLADSETNTCVDFKMIFPMGSRDRLSIHSLKILKRGARKIVTQ